MPTISAGQQQTITLEEGRALTLTGTAGTSGVAYLLDPKLGGTNSQWSQAIGPGPLAQIGPMVGAQRVLVTCAVGSIETAVINPSLSAPALVTPSGGNATALSLNGRSRRFSVDSIKGASKWFGGAIAGVTFGGPVANASSYRATYGLTCVAEAPFYAVQLVYVNLANNAITGLRAIAGVTETIALNVPANLCKPVINGVTYGAMAAAGSINGFFPMTWGGAASATIPASVTSSQIVATDILPLNSIPRVDVAGGLHAVVFRVDHDPATGGKFSFVATSVAMRTATPENRGRVVQTFNYGADALTNPALNVALSTDSHLIFPIFHYAVPSLTVVVASDSTGQNDSLVASVFTSWGFRGCADASTPTRPVNYVNLGCSSKGAAEYWLRTQELVAAGITPDVLVISPASVNDGYTVANLARTFADHRSRAMEIIRFARASGILNVCFIPLLPQNSLSVLQESYRVAFNTWLTTVAGATVLSFPGLGDGGMPERWLPSTGQYGSTSVTGSISGTTLTVAAMGAASAPVTPGQKIFGAGVTADTTIVAYGSGTGGVGTYIVSTSQTVANTAISSTGTCTISNGSPAVVTIANSVVAGQSCMFTTTSSLPAGIPPGTQLFVAATPAPTAATFSVSLTPGGAAIATTSAGAGTQSVFFGQDGFHENEFAIETLMAPPLTRYLNTVA